MNKNLNLGLQKIQNHQYDLGYEISRAMNHYPRFKITNKKKADKTVFKKIERIYFQNDLLKD